MQTYRLFIAVTLPNTVKTQLVAVQKRFQQSLKLSERGKLPMRFTKRTQLHITLQFLGDTPVAMIDALSAQLTSHLAMVSPFTLAFNRLGTFPNVHKARILWAGDSQQNLGLTNAHQAATSAVKQTGRRVEARAFKPHVTLGRTQKWARKADYAQIEAALKQQPNLQTYAFQITDIALIRSELQRSGPKYTILARIPLATTED